MALWRDTRLCEKETSELELPSSPTGECNLD